MTKGRWNRVGGWEWGCVLSRAWVLCGMLGALMLMVPGLTVAAAGNTPANATARAKAPATRVTTLDGQSVDVAAWQGQVVIVDFWATWCPPCREEIPHFKALYAKYHPRVEILGLALDQDGAKTVAPFVREWQIPYPVAMADEALVAAYGGVRGIPTTFVLDPQGRIYKKYVGYQAQEVFERDITTLLKES